MKENEYPVFSKEIDRIKHITAQKVAEKQDKAKMNFPAIMIIIDAAAKQGESYCTVEESRMNEYDKKLLETEGFTVWLTDKPRLTYEQSLRSVQQYSSNKEWKISW